MSRKDSEVMEVDGMKKFKVNLAEPAYIVATCEAEANARVQHLLVQAPKLAPEGELKFEQVPFSVAAAKEFGKK